MKTERRRKRRKGHQRSAEDGELHEPCFEGALGFALVVNDASTIIISYQLHIIIMMVNLDTLSTSIDEMVAD